MFRAKFSLPFKVRIFLKTRTREQLELFVRLKMRAGEKLFMVKIIQQTKKGKAFLHVTIIGRLSKPATLTYQTDMKLEINFEAGSR